MKQNCTFHCFKPSGKWYTSARGILTRKVFEFHSHAERRAQIVADNEGAYPGLATDGAGLIFVVIDDDDNTVGGYPLMLHPEAL